MQLRRADSGARVAIRTGDTVDVRLPENPTTGYRWHAEIDSTALRQVGDQYEGPTSPRGASGARVLTFEALRPGQTLLRLVNRRSWEAEVSDEFLARISVSSP
jgi:inhibitor of cysteine peptidase